VAGLKTGQAVKVKAWGGEQLLAARLNEISASADPVTRTFTVKATLQDMKMPLGSTATVVLDGQAASAAMLLPTSAIRQEAGKTSVWVLDTATMTVRSQAIEVGAIHDNAVTVSSGLQPGQQVVTAGVHVLSPGQKVTYFKATGGSQ
jgi:membrane fusion protein, multidrug efflux system